MLIDETLTFFLAGSQTNSASTQNLLLHLVINPSYGEQLVEELEEKIVKPYHIENYEETGETWKPSRISDMLTYENITNLDFISNCYNESMRIQPPVYYSSTSAMT